MLTPMVRKDMMDATLGARPEVGFSRVLGLPAAVSVGATASVALGALVLGPEVLRIAGGEAPAAFVLAAFLYLPLILCYAERGAGLAGSVSAYQIARASGSPRRLFLAGWLLLGGYAVVAALLAVGLAERLQAGSEVLFGIRYKSGALTFAVLAGFTLYKLLSTRGGWRTQTVVGLGTLAALTVLMVRALSLPRSDAELVVTPLGHWLTSVALLGASLWGLELVLDLRGQLHHAARTALWAVLLAWLAMAGLGALIVVLGLRHPEAVTDRRAWIAQLSWESDRLALLSMTLIAVLCGLGLLRAMERGVRVIRAMARDGLLPNWLTHRDELRSAWRSLLAFGLLAAACCTASRLTLGSAASLLILLITSLVLLPYARRPAAALARDRFPRLPFHPLFPGTTLVGVVFFAVILPRTGLVLGLAWLLLGGLLFLLDGRHRVVALAKSELEVGAWPFRHTTLSMRYSMKWHREPLIHFLALGAGLFLLYGLVADPEEDASGKIDVTPGQVEQLVLGFQKTWQRPPTAAELDGLIEERVREEVFYREALAMGLDRDDTIVRRRLRQKLEFISEDVAALVKPTEADLAAYLEEHADAFRRPSRVSFRQVYLNRDRRAEGAPHDDNGDAVLGDAERLLAELREAGDADASALGDPFLLPSAYEALPEDEVAKLYGRDFAARLAEVPPGGWTGPVESGYGLHLVEVQERWEGQLPTLGETRDAVEREWAAARRRETAEAFYESLRGRYTVSVERPEWAREVAEVRP